MKPLYEIRVSIKGQKPYVIRLCTEKQARESVEKYKKDGISAKYIGKKTTPWGHKDKD